MVMKAILVAGALWLTASAANGSQQAPPANLSPAALAAFNAYLASPVGKAFAVGPSGGFGWAAGYERTEAARSEALASCQRANPAASCVIISVDGQAAP
jgi:hypothetical protein